jgi:hypothetical protein
VLRLKGVLHSRGDIDMMFIVKRRFEGIKVNKNLKFR